MKTSSYNYILYKDGFSYWFNGISKSYFRLSQELGKKIEKMLLLDPNVLLKQQKIAMKLIDNGFLIDEKTNELELIRKKNVESINDQNYYLIVLPTLNCNFACWYCIQDHIPSAMTPETINKVKAHIHKIIFEDRISSLHLEWFGGEPFMYFEKVIVPISIFAMEKCKEANIPFLNASTTNGYYLQSKIHDSLKNLNFKRFQITLDGPKNCHNKVKNQKGLTSAFDHVLENINGLLTNDNEIILYLRINYTQDNLNKSIVSEINEHINESNRERVLIIPRKVWQESKTGLSDKLSDVIKVFKESKYKVQELDIINNFIPCYANRKNYVAINHNGSVVKCTAHDDLYSKEPPGQLNDDGSIIWKEGFLGRFNKKRFENSKCLKCKYLPICMGICSRDYDKETGNEKSYYCKMQHQTFRIEEMIINFINSSYE